MQRDYSHKAKDNSISGGISKALKVFNVCESKKFPCEMAIKVTPLVWILQEREDEIRVRRRNGTIFAVYVMEFSLRMPYTIKEEGFNFAQTVFRKLLSLFNKSNFITQLATLKQLKLSVLPEEVTSSLMQGKDKETIKKRKRYPIKEPSAVQVQIQQKSQNEIGEELVQISHLQTIMNEITIEHRAQYKRAQKAQIMAKSQISARHKKFNSMSSGAHIGLSTARQYEIPLMANIIKPINLHCYFDDRSSSIYDPFKEYEIMKTKTEKRKQKVRQHIASQRSNEKQRLPSIITQEEKSIIQPTPLDSPTNSLQKLTKSASSPTYKISHSSMNGSVSLIQKMNLQQKSKQGIETFKMWELQDANRKDSSINQHLIPSINQKLSKKWDVKAQLNREVEENSPNYQLEYSEQLRKGVQFREGQLQDKMDALGQGKLKSSLKGIPSLKQSVSTFPSIGFQANEIGSQILTV